MKRYTFLLFLLLSSNNLFSTDYRRFSTLGEARKLVYENSNCIFAGIPQSQDSNIVKFSVIESFKGSMKDEAIVKFHFLDCEEKMFSFWLIYGNLKDDTIFSVSPLSRSVDNPFIIGASKSPTLMIDESKRETVVIKEDPIERALLENRWRNEFYDEIMILRELRNYNNTKEKNDVTDVFCKMINYKHLTYAIIFLVILIFSTLLFFVLYMPKTFTE